MALVGGNGHTNLCSKILDKAVCISCRANSLGKAMYPAILPPAISDV